MGSNGNDVEVDLVVQMRIPAFGYSLTEFTVIELPKLGQSLVTGECACVLESDKAIHEVAAPCSGTVSEHHASLGQILPVGSLLVSIDGKGVASPNSVTASKDCEVGSEVAVSNSSQSWQIAPMKIEDFEEAWNIWINNQKLASRDWNLQCFPNLRSQFSEMLKSGLQAPFSIHCAFKDGRLDGWAGVFPTKNNPLSRDKIGEVSLYVSDPNATHTAGILLMNHVIAEARHSGMAFLIGMTNPNNLSVQKLLKATKFELLGSAGKLQTQIWVYNF